MSEWFTIHKQELNGLYIISFKGGCTDNDLNRYFSEFSILLKNKDSKSLKIIFDVSKIQHVNLTHIMKNISFMNLLRPQIKRCLIRFAIIYDKSNKLLANTTKFMFSLYKPVSPYIITDNLEDAMMFIMNKT